MRKSLLEFTENKEQRDIVIAVKEGTLMSELPVEKVVDSMAQWRLMLGLHKDGANPQELAIAATFVHAQFGHITIEELNLACLNFILGRYDKKIEFYGVLSPLFVSQVINGYLYYRKMSLAQPARNKEKYEEQLLLEQSSSKPPREEECKTTKKIIQDFYNDWKANGEFVDVLSVAYNFLRPRKEVFGFHLDSGRIKKAEEWAAKKYLQDRDKDLLLDKLQVAELRKKRYARTWCVMDYFSRVENVDEILNKITPELF